MIKLTGGGLFVYNPVAPTQECLLIMKDIEKNHEIYATSLAEKGDDISSPVKVVNYTQSCTIL